MKTFSEPGKYELFVPRHEPFCVKGNDIEIVGPPNRVVISLEYTSNDNVMIIEGENITLRNIEFDIDFLTFSETSRQGSFYGVSCVDCRNLTFENCWMIVRCRTVGGFEGEGPSEVQYRVIDAKTCHDLTLISTLADIRQTLPDGTIVRHVCGQNGSSLYVNGYAIVQPSFVVQS